MPTAPSRKPPISLALARLSAPFLALTLLLASAGCATWPEVDSAAWMGSVGAPNVRRVRDLGTRLPPPAGQRLQGESDGVASPGEYLLIEGWGFGKSPAVTVDGRATEVVARTEGGGIVARVPGGITPGERAVEVQVGDARSSMAFPMRRLVATLRDGELRAFSLNGETLTAWGPPLPLPGARLMVINTDGSFAYVLAGKQVLVIDLGASGGPARVNQRDVAIAATHLAASPLAARFLAVMNGAVQVFETSDPRAPAPYQPTTLPAECKGMVRADLDATGNRVAVLIPEGNRVAVVDITRPAKPRLLGTTGVLPEARVPMVRDLRYSPDGEFVWVVSGDSTASLAVGTQPTRLSVVRIARPEGVTEGDPQVETWRVVQLGLAWAPVRATAMRALPVSSGAAVRLPPEKTLVRFTAVPSALLAAGAAASASSLSGAVEQGDATGETLRAAEPRLILGSSYATPDSGALVAAAVRAEAGKRDWGLLVVTFSKPPTSTYTTIGPAQAADPAPPFDIADVAMQP